MPQQHPAGLIARDASALSGGNAGNAGAAGEEAVRRRGASVTACWCFARFGCGEGVRGGCGGCVASLVDEGEDGRVEEQQPLGRLREVEASGSASSSASAPKVGPGGAAQHKLSDGTAEAGVGAGAQQEDAIG